MWVQRYGQVPIGSLKYERKLKQKFGLETGLYGYSLSRRIALYYLIGKKTRKLSQFEYPGLTEILYPICKYSSGPGPQFLCRLKSFQ